ncbi:MAG TPA: ABC transporter permease, partial [Candidatus Limnocylindrales bacterium]|nr:ABC transporter permease [Candidatus Limnocylindrales bacterium]
DRDGGAAAHVLVDEVLGSLVEADVLEFERMSGEAAAADAVRAGEAGAAIIIPAGLDAAIQAGRPAEIRILGGEYAVPLELARSAVSRFASAVGTVQLMVATSSALGDADVPGAVAAAQAAIHDPAPIGVVDTAIARLQAGLATFYGAAMAIMFVFFATQYGALALLSDRQVGTMNRLLAAPISPASILLGASIAGFVMGLVAMVVLVVATTILQDANWGAPGLVAALVLAAVAAAMGISTLASSIARTPQQAGGLNAIVALSLAAVGGVFIPVSQAPESLATVSQVTPHFWFLRGIDTLASPASTLADIAPSIAILLAMAVITGAVGLARARRTLVA